MTINDRLLHSGDLFNCRSRSLGESNSCRLIPYKTAQIPNGCRCSSARLTPKRAFSCRVKAFHLVLCFSLLGVSQELRKWLPELLHEDSSSLLAQYTFSLQPAEFSADSEDRRTCQIRNFPVTNAIADHNPFLARCTESTCKFSDCPLHSFPNRLGLQTAGTIGEKGDVSNRKREEVEPRTRNRVKQSHGKPTLPCQQFRLLHCLCRIEARRSGNKRGVSKNLPWTN